VKLHRISEIWRDLSAEEYTTLAASIAAEGLRVPILTWRGSVVDGKHRQRACLETGTEPRYEALDDALEESAVWAHVKSLHRGRRNDAPSQAVATILEGNAWYDGARAEAAERQADGRIAGGHARHGAALAPRGAQADAGKVAAVIARDAGVAERTVERGLYVQARRPDLMPQIKAGTLTVAQAERVVRKEADRAALLSAAPSLAEGPACEVVTADAREFCAAIEPKSVALLLTDPPYGIDVHRTRQGGQDYADGEDYALNLLEETLTALTPALRDDAHAYVFTGYTHIDAFRQALESHGWDVQPWPIIWQKDNHTMCAFDQWYACDYELVLFARRSKARKLRQFARAIQAADRSQVRAHHSAAKPEELLRRFIEQSTVPGECVVDPFCGAGSTLVAAKSCGREALGADIDPANAELARHRVR
jgi:site-specific DNA-methyltransferase (adenine-specific)